MKNYKDAISIAKREKNPKREFLLLNTLQGKHTPSKPHETLNMFHDLGNIIKNNLTSFENYVAIGFAETATAIGITIGQQLNIPTMQTTRETIEDVEYLFFSEEHSHATEQKIIKNDLDYLFTQGVDGILFIEDELTTGNTILNGIKIIKQIYADKKINFAVASIINCMQDEHFKRFEDNNVQCFYCDKYNINEEIHNINSIKFEKDEDIYKKIFENTKNIDDTKDVKIEIFSFQNGFNLRRQSYFENTKVITKNFIDNFNFGEKDKEILVLGTEEFMFIGLKFAYSLYEKGYGVYFHATTRSPMLPSFDENYIIKNRHKLRSLYDENRTTFIYNLKKYDEIYIVTDAVVKNNVGVEDLVYALKNFGNDNIKILEWNNGN